MTLAGSFIHRKKKKGGMLPFVAPLSRHPICQRGQSLLKKGGRKGDATLYILGRDKRTFQACMVQVDAQYVTCYQVKMVASPFPLSLSSKTQQEKRHTTVSVQPDL